MIVSLFYMVLPVFMLTGSRDVFIEGTGQKTERSGPAIMAEAELYR